MYVDRAGPPLAWAVLEAVVGHHEMQALEELGRVFELRIGRKLQYEGHCVAVAGQGNGRFVVGVQWLLSHRDGGGVIERSVVALDAVGPLDRASEGQPA